MLRPSARSVRLLCSAAASLLALGCLLALLPEAAVAASDVTRIDGKDRFDTAVSIARAYYDPAGDRSWAGPSGRGVSSVVLVCGEDKAIRDALLASGFGQGPIFLTKSDSVPWKVKGAIDEIVKAHGAITVVIIGGTTSVPDARFDDLADYVRPLAIKKRRIGGSDRYRLSAAIAEASKPSGWDSDENAWCYIVNGEDDSKLNDAAVASVLCRNSAYLGNVILFVRHDSMSYHVKRNLWGWYWPVIIGGPDSVSERLAGEITDRRVYGKDRYETAVAVAEQAERISWGTYTMQDVGIGAALPDMLTGGAAMGAGHGYGPPGGPLLLAEPDGLPSATRSFLRRHNTEKAVIFGGTASVSNTVRDEIAAALD